MGTSALMLPFRKGCNSCDYSLEGGVRRVVIFVTTALRAV